VGEDDLSIPVKCRDDMSPNERTYLSSLNDSGFTFDQIADLIDYFF
jgi:hypothetical protein